MTPRIKKIIKAASMVAASAGVGLGFTGGDVPAVAVAWGGMMCGIAAEHGVSLDKKTCVKSCAGIIGMIATYKMGSVVLTFAVNALLATCTFGASLFLACGINGVINALATYRLGKLFDKMYGEESMSTAVTQISLAVAKSLFAIPSPSEFTEFIHDLKN